MKSEKLKKNKIEKLKKKVKSEVQEDFTFQFNINRYKKITLLFFKEKAKPAWERTISPWKASSPITTWSNLKKKKINGPYFIIFWSKRSSNKKSQQIQNYNDLFEWKGSVTKKEKGKEKCARSVVI